MLYRCEKCEKESKELTFLPDNEMWLCHKCYWSKPTNVVELEHGRPSKTA
jgi:hypothetical protein